MPAAANPSFIWILCGLSAIRDLNPHHVCLTSFFMCHDNEITTLWYQSDWNTRLVGARAAPYWCSPGLLTLEQLEKWWETCRAQRTGYFPADLEICQCFYNQRNHIGVYHLNISTGLRTTEEPTTCFHEVLWKGLDALSRPWFGYYDYTEIKV